MGLAGHELGPVPHALLSAPFALAAGAHVLVNATWVTGVARRARRRGLPRRLAGDAVTSALLGILSVAITVTGILALLDPGDSGDGTGLALLDGASALHGDLVLPLLVVTVVHIVRQRRRRRGTSGARPARSPSPRQAATPVAG